MRPCGKGKYQCMNNTKIEKEREYFYWKNEEIFRWKAHINTWKLNWYALTIKDVFLNQKMWCHLYCISIYIYSLLIKKDISDCQNISVKLPCVYVCLSSGDLFIFSVRVSSFFLYFYVTYAHTILKEKFWSRSGIKSLHHLDSSIGNHKSRVKFNVKVTSNNSLLMQGCHKSCRAEDIRISKKHIMRGFQLSWYLIPDGIMLCKLI